MRRLAIVLIGTLCIASGLFAELALAQSPSADGEALYNTNCRTCHSVKPGDHRLGPSLAGIVGKEAGKAEGYGNYSGALQGFAWDEATLDRFIADPAALAPSTSMVYPPVKDSGERQKIIGYLKGLSAD